MIGSVDMHMDRLHCDKTGGLTLNFGKTVQTPVRFDHVIASGYGVRGGIQGPCSKAGDAGRSGTLVDDPQFADGHARLADRAVCL